MSEQFVIVGAGLAGAKAAETLRTEGFSGRVVLVGDEDVRPYERPPLSKGLLLGTATRDDAFVHSAQWYADNDVDLRAGVRATSIDRDSQAVVLADGSRLTYDRLLLATGSRPRRLSVPGADLGNVLSLRTLADSQRLDAYLREGTNVVLIGGGWIGLEVAAAARTRGANVTVIEVATLPLQRVLGDEVATVYHDLHVGQGVKFHCGVMVRELLGGDTVTSVMLGDDTEVPADVVVVGVGIEPNLELALEAGLEVAGGIVVDSSLRTADPNIFAAGDVAAFFHPLLGRQIRVEHWANALNGGPAAARSMLGLSTVYDRIPYFYSDQYTMGMEYSGYAGPSDYDQVVYRGDPDSGEFIAFWVSDGRVLAGMNVNVWDVQDHIQALVRAGFGGHRVDAAKLADPSLPLADLLA
jgi:3-phenylpropionate/trans-cinnamate dioxygenase ferredoxin reductase component